MIKGLLAMTFMAMLAACSASDSAVTEDTGPRPLRMTVGTEQYSDTRGTAITSAADMDVGIGLFAYSYASELEWNDGNVTPNFMRNEELQYRGEAWTTVNVFELPNKAEDGKPVRFFGYYPFEGDGLVFPAEGSDAEQGGMQFTYTVPELAENQKDLLAGAGNAVYTTYTALKDGISMTMHHLLTAVSFEIEKSSVAGHVDSIILRNVLRTNTYSMKDDGTGTNNIIGWAHTDITSDDDVNKYGTCRQELDIEVTETAQRTDPGTSEITKIELPATATFLMLPHTLSNETDEGLDAEVELIFTCDGQARHIKASLGGRTWAKGTHTLYTINIESLQKMSIKSSLTNWDAQAPISEESSEGITIKTNAVLNGWSEKSYSSNGEDGRTADESNDDMYGE